jgi:hypothetical protein
MQTLADHSVKLVLGSDEVKTDDSNGRGKSGSPDGIPIFNLGNFLGPWNGRCWYTYFMAAWSILRRFVFFVAIW